MKITNVKLWLFAIIPLVASASTNAEILGDSENICVPSGNEITSATLVLKSQYASYSGDLNIEKIIGATDLTETWDESTVTWNNFNDNFYTEYVDNISLDNAMSGFSVQQITQLVESWMLGDDVNHGVLLSSSLANSIFHVVFSSESQDSFNGESVKPKLVIEFSHYPALTIQRNETETMVYDAFISSLNPDANDGQSPLLVAVSFPEFTGKNSIVKFDLPEFCQTDGPGVGTPGYWKNHEWPDVDLTFGGTTYDESTLRRIMKHKNKKGDKSIDMLKHLAATTFNLAIGNDDSCIADAVADANNWLATYAPNVPANISADSYAWQEGGGDALMNELDYYNNGLLPCAGPRD